MTTDSAGVVQRAGASVPKTYEGEDMYQLPKVNREYEKQFASLYTHRLMKLRPRVLAMASAKWTNETINGEKVVRLSKILDIAHQQPCYMVGTVYCDMQFKPNVLKDVSENMYGAPPIVEGNPLDATNRNLRQTSYSNPATDQIALEDESGRVLLSGDIIDNTVFVTGCVFGVLGLELESGVFEVVDVVYPEIAPQVPRSLDHVVPSKIALVSGMSINSSDLDLVKLEILKEYLTGELGNDETRAASAQISKLIIAGDSIQVSQSLIGKDYAANSKSKYKKNHRTNYNAEAVNILDSFLCDVLQSLPVDIMPGENDPAELSLPQQPLHVAFFPKSRQFINTESRHFRPLTNPARLEIDGLHLLGTSGQNINDIFRYVLPNAAASTGTTPTDDDHVESRIGLIEANMYWQNIVPTAPDTLWCYPYQDEDPFTLYETPHVYFVGNMPRFETQETVLHQKSGKEVKVRVIAVPNFSATGEIVLLDTASLACETVKIVG
ncbi:unnamed protein product [Kuraishia capsulata CBS 1993]|uniref:DNA-directed DNA polymerase n=1 Tax=Kuraishia capsulata CBS 1993 TaxID=1382522 RepID=W6MLC6_9ASCO|nr:uncharacterized protein KUCA_T00003254001 [Kuraishia capsulata CBS 1993]CDK27276.1 unnamed protein product [Kuraishia capsulata CBS 1993]